MSWHLSPHGLWLNLGFCLSFLFPTGDPFWVAHQLTKSLLPGPPGFFEVVLAAALLGVQHDQHEDDERW